MSYNRWAYVEGNPVNWTDPKGQYLCSACQAAPQGWAYALCMRYCCGGPPVETIDCRRLSGDASRIGETYIALRDHEGWWSRGSWNGNRPGPLSPQAFAGLVLRMEFSDAFQNIAHGVQLETVVRNFYAHCSYWSGCRGDSRSWVDIFIFLDNKRLFEIGTRENLLVDVDADERVIGAKWRNDEGRYSHADFEYGFLCPGEWVTGIGSRRYVAELGKYLYTEPFDWGNLKMIQDISENKYREAIGKIEKGIAEGLDEDQFYLVRGNAGERAALILTYSQRRYWKGS